jgi:hypothetical protein
MEGDERLLLVVDGSDARSDTDLSLLLLEDGVFDVLEVRRVVSPADGSHAAQVSAVVATLLGDGTSSSHPIRGQGNTS